MTRKSRVVKIHKKRRPSVDELWLRYLEKEQAQVVKIVTIKKKREVLKNGEEE